MKSLIISSLLVLSTSAFSAEFLVKQHSNSGFSPIPTQRTVTFTETGKVVEVKIVKGVKSTSVLKTISPNTVQSLKDAIDGINVKDKLIDLNASKPKCMDAPSSSVSVSKNGKEIVIAERFTCHSSEMQSAGAKKVLATLIKIQE